MKSTRLLTRLALLLLGSAALCAPAAAFATATSCGGAGEGDLAPAPSPASAASSALAAALDAVHTDYIRADIHFIASDELEGRYTPSHGLRIAARYIRARLQRLGFEPGAEDGYFHTYPLVRSLIDEAATCVAVEGPAGEFRLRLGADYFYRYASFWEDLTVSGPLVYCGTGSDEELEPLDLKDAWALILDNGEDSWRASSKAKRSGSVGSIFLPSASFQGESYAERFGPELEKAREGSFRYSTGGESRGRMRMRPQIYLTREAGQKLLALAPGRPEGADLSAWLPPVGTRFAATLRDEHRLSAAGGEELVENVCGFWRGSDPELSKEVILVSAHYDHMGIQGGEIQNGADDNGSGTSGLLALAEALQCYGPLRRSVLLIWVSGEERGLWGSRAWSTEPWLPHESHAVANLNIDMIGRNAPAELYITPSTDHDQYNGIVRIAQGLAKLEGFDELGNADEFYHRSDQANFATLDIPVAFLFSGLHDDYHKPTDDPDKIDYDKIRRVVRLLMRLLDALQAGPLDE